MKETLFLILMSLAGVVRADDVHCSNADGSLRMESHTYMGGPPPLTGTIVGVRYWYRNGTLVGEVLDIANEPPKTVHYFSVKWDYSSKKILKHQGTPETGQLIDYTIRGEWGQGEEGYFLCRARLLPPMP